MKLPTPKEVIETYDRDEQVRTFVEHNIANWRNIEGSWALVESSTLNFRPREDYWFLVERRVLVSYFSGELGQLYTPPAPMRNLAYAVFRHFDQARKQGRLGPVIEAKDQPAQWGTLSTSLIETAQQLPDLTEFGRLGPRAQQRSGTTLKESLLAFLKKLADLDGPGELDEPFRFRLPWFPYLDLAEPNQLEERQKYFASFYTIFASTNSYKQGGAQSMAPILQNNPTSEILGYVRKWAQGKTPLDTRFDVLAKDTRKDRSDYAPVIELFTFLNLPRQPIYNNAAKIYQDLGEASLSSVYSRFHEMGISTQAFLKSDPAATDSLSSRFRRLVSGVEGEAQITMEAPPIGDSVADPTLAPADLAIGRAIREAGIKRAEQYSASEAAAALYHLMVDSVIYCRSRNVEVVERPSPTAAAPVVVPPPESDEIFELPPSLRPKANDALAYLRAESHVLFAGVPGTGKTTLAQFVGHAWNHNLPQVALRIPRSQSPFMTVGNSAWAPFHTIGGILPDGRGNYVAHTGVFIDPACREESEWQLRPHAVVLDEMNRADLDRAIGELYPILSRSADRVVPAGIPRVTTVRLHPRFRILATVNDSTLDDIVFPISEGLARRFVRIELPGASKEEITTFLSTRAAAGVKEHLDAATEAVGLLFHTCEALGQLTKSEEGQRLPFGAGYFGLLAFWAAGTLRMSEEFQRCEPKEQARRILATSIGSAARNVGMRKVLRKLAGQPDSE